MRGDDQGTGLNTLSSVNDRFSLPILDASFQPQDVHGQARPPTSILQTLKGILPRLRIPSLISEGCTRCHSRRLCGFLQLLPRFSHLTLHDSTPHSNTKLPMGGCGGGGQRLGVAQCQSTCLESSRSGTIQPSVSRMPTGLFSESL